MRRAGREVGPSMSDVVITLVRALDFVARKHTDQRRKGAAAEPYINHLTEVALGGGSDPGQDRLAVLGALLHDTIEDTTATTEELEAEFGAEVAALVAEVTGRQALLKSERKRLQIETARHKSRRPS
jgi:(p)ppGpp synthase/HD superfamily hydrolase